MTDVGQSEERILKGIPVSSGVCHGKVIVLKRADVQIPHYQVPEDELAQQVQRFEQALVATRQDVLAVQKKINTALGDEEARIFDAHLLVLEDPVLIDSVTNTVMQKRVNVEWAFCEFAEKYAATLNAIDDNYLRERAADMRDVTNRILNNLLGIQRHDLQSLTTPCILIAPDLPPSETAFLDRKIVLGIGTDIGSKTSHTAIMARSLQIPAVTGLQHASEKLHSGVHVLLDGFNGLLIINPSDQTLFEYGQLAKRQASIQDKLREVTPMPAVTLDGRRYILSANIEQTSDIDSVKQFGAEGVGLFRTEYLFINRSTLPTEEEQYRAYRKVASELSPAPVIIRTLDLGGDKFNSQMQIDQEMNPFLGWRAIRFCLEEREIFRAQLRAILRASAEGNIKMMYPMVSGRGELLKANALVEEYKAELRAEGVPFDENLEIGAMIEIPSAAISADILGRNVKFFSIGTNDLIQYTLAVDRMNQKIAHLYEPTHPAIVRLIKMTADAAHANGIWCGVCGEMAGDPELTPLLLALGADELSVAPPLVPQIKFMIRRLKLDEIKELGDAALNSDSSREILEWSKALARKAAPGLFDTQLSIP
jgi:phosphotransferase system enzyme I (PtsI)